jgi:hypothetical protein
MGTVKVKGSMAEATGEGEQQRVLEVEVLAGPGQANGGTFRLVNALFRWCPSRSAPFPSSSLPACFTTT